MYRPWWEGGDGTGGSGHCESWVAEDVSVVADSDREMCTAVRCQLLLYHRLDELR